MNTIKTINTQLTKQLPLYICRLHLENFKLYESSEYPGTNLAFLVNKRVIRDELELLLNNLVLTYGESTVILALRSTKMLNYCRKYLKVS